MEVVPMRMSSLLLIPLLALTATAQARSNGAVRPIHAELTVTSNSVATPTFDLAGRMIGMETKRFDADGSYSGSSSYRYVYDAKGRIQQSSYVIADSEDLIVQRMETVWQFNIDGVARKGKRTWYDGWDEMQRWEQIVWRQDPIAPILTIQTEYFDGDDELVKTSFSVLERDDRGRVKVQDVSVFFPDNAQMSRTFERWIYVDQHLSRVERVHFDEADEITKRERASRQYNAQNRLVGINTRTTDAGHELISTSKDTRRHNAAAKLIHRSVEHADAQGIATRRYVETTSYDIDGRLQARRSSWETLQ